MSDLRRTPRINLSVALTAPLLLHRLLFITPLSRGPHKRLYSSTPLIVYYLTVMLLYTLANIMFLANNSGHTRSAIDTYGYTWYGILTIDFFLNKASFLFISGMSVYRRHCQIEFFHTIAAIDARLRRHCGVRMHYERLLVGYAVVLVGCFVSTYVAWRMALQSLGIVELIADKALMNIWMFSVMFVLERLPVMLITVAFACCALLIRQRLQQLANRLRWQRGAGVAARCGAVSFEHTMQVYTDLCRLTELLSGYMGAIMLMRLVHDFLSITTSAYFLFSAMIQRPDNVRRSWVSSYGSALALFGLQLASPVLVCLTAEWTLMAVSGTVNCVGFLVMVGFVCLAEAGLSARAEPIRDEDGGRPGTDG